MLYTCTYKKIRDYLHNSYFSLKSEFDILGNCVNIIKCIQIYFWYFQVKKQLIYLLLKYILPPEPLDIQYHKSIVYNCWTDGPCISAERYLRAIEVSGRHFSHPRNQNGLFRHGCRIPCTMGSFRLYHRSQPPRVRSSRRSIPAKSPNPHESDSASMAHSPLRSIPRADTRLACERPGLTPGPCYLSYIVL